MAGLTPTETAKAIDMIRSLRYDGITLMVVEHNMRAIMSLSDRIVAFDHGAKIAEGSPVKVSNHPEVIDSYLGAEVSMLSVENISVHYGHVPASVDVEACTSVKANSWELSVPIARESPPS